MTKPAQSPVGVNGRRPTSRLFLGLIAGSVGGAIVTTVAAIGLFMHRTDTIQTYPASSAGNYAAAVKRVHSPMDIDRYEVWLGRLVDGGVPRGHVVTVPLAWSTEPRIDWNQDMVVLHFQPGGEIRVPMTMVLDDR
ncbi:hypothetical protein [Nocardia aurantiaca]|uniref:Uncharacterized protein n=1 Tax=Nocardia aurantiaca TaxID=2675850 RepID=A0A6I3KVV0_9NOCA|nr:hypothetical protein [Nocardia aurantiaca]MTE13707.1 hypothetical protein [Nocardia aurantiaca]